MATEGLPASRHFRLQPLDDGVYAAIATPDGWAVGNAGFVDLGDDVIVFDTFANHIAAHDLRAAAEAATGKSVAYVVNSHAHRDHVKGNQVFPDARIVATRGTTETMTQNWRRRSERVRREGLDPIRKEVEAEFESWKESPATTETDRVLWEGYRQAILEGIEAYDLKLPTLSFETRLGFHGSRETAEALSFGGGHSASDALLFLPERRVAFLGDLLFVGFQPYVGDGDPDACLRILDQIEALDAKILVPGHGPVGTSDDLRTMRDYVTALQTNVHDARGRGAGPGSVIGDAIPARFATLKWRAFWRENLDALAKRGAVSDGPPPSP